MIYHFDADPCRKSANALVEEFHYSGYVPANVQYVAGLRDSLFGELVAAIFITIPATRWKFPVFELARLVRHPDHRPHLSSLIGRCVKELRRRKGADLVVSFADNTQGHHGGVYQASSWHFHEMRKPRCDAFVIDGELVPARTCNHRFGTSSTKTLPELLALFDIRCEPHYDAGKFLYWKDLAPSGKLKAEALGLKSIPYAKPHVAPSLDDLFR